MTDPTGTAVLRRAFQADGNRRLGRVRSLTHTILVEHDLMHARNDPLAQFLPHPGHRLAAFAEWFARTVDQQLLAGGWWEKYLQRAYDSGLVAGGELVGPPPGNQRPLPAVYSELARRELAGIAAALVQQVSRQAGFAGITKQKPQMMYRQVLTVLKKIGMVRLEAFVNFMVVKLHNAARLEQFRAAGVTRVGIVPERLVNPRPSRFLKHDHSIHDASAKRKVAQAQLELRIAQGRARKEVEAAKAATAEREVEAKAAWEKVLAARKEARAAEYAATRTAKTAAKTETPRAEAKAEEAKIAAVGAQAKAVETEAQNVVRLLPARLLVIGAEYVNVLTAGDRRVCQVCQDASEEGPYSLEEAQGILPLHPRCRCAWVPAIVKPELAAAE